MSPLNISPYIEAAHYAQLDAIYQSYGWESVPRECLSSKGVVAVNLGRVIAASFLYTCADAAFALISMTTVSKDAGASVRVGALREVVRAIVMLAKEAVGPKGIVLTFTNNPAAARYYQREGMMVGESRTSSYFLPVGLIGSDFLKEDAA